MPNVATARRRASPPQPQATPSASHESAGGTTLLLDKADLARELRGSIKLIDRMIAQGKLPAGVMVGKRRRWPRATIVEWVGLGCPSATDFARMTKT